MASVEHKYSPEEYQITRQKITKSMQILNNKISPQFNAVKQRIIQMAVGNIVGSNIFNTFAVMGIPALIGNLTIPSGIIVFTLPVSIGAALMYVIITMDKKINRLEGSLMLLFYCFFIGSIFNLI